MPISEDEFRTIDEDTPLIDLASDTTQGTIYRFLLENADKAFRQREIVDHVDVPRGSVGPTLKRLERRGLVDHRGRYWKIADAEHATAAAGLVGAVTADEIDGGFSDEAVEEWMETAVDPIDEPDGGNGV
ncbi:MarR family transcriptional regulator [Halovivax cerinus]|uniref:MarR family transcriptional regulator n=1 Tax=Halovivax cerinus TaxID=1487865 RepID=A0ABD5NQZ7_9EURY|nr:MarR family transcriptional regulator [Halovivax cerinus]